jgi:CHAT domain-containing protein
VVAPADSGLASAQSEKAYILSLAGPARRATEVTATYLDVTQAMMAGTFDGWHFSGHARADHASDANQSVVELTAGDILTPEDLSGEVGNVLAPRPFVFLNACQSGQGGLSLTGLGGWAQRFLRPHGVTGSASGFVGSYWSVLDDSADTFARTFYGALLTGKPVGEAVRHARAAIRNNDDPTWLAYTVYADPNARVEEGPLSSPPS